MPDADDAAVIESALRLKINTVLSELQEAVDTAQRAGLVLAWYGEPTEENRASAEARLHNGIVVARRKMRQAHAYYKRLVALVGKREGVA